MEGQSSKQTNVIFIHSGGYHRKLFLVIKNKYEFTIEQNSGHKRLKLNLIIPK